MDEKRSQKYNEPPSAAETLPKLTRFFLYETQKNMFVVGSYLDNAARMVVAAFQSNQNKPAHTHIQVSTFEIM